MSGQTSGQTAITFSRAFPAALVFSFEPDPDTYRELCQRLATYACVKPFALGLGDREGDATLLVNHSSETNSFLKPLPGAAEYLVEPGVLARVASRHVSMTTLDAFCREKKLDRIDLLKLDVQGYELKVLEGASQLLAKRAIPLIYLEVSFVRTYENQPLFPDVYRYLFDRGYRFVGLYESGHETHYYHVGGNALFVQEELGRRRKDLTVEGVHVIGIRSSLPLSQEQPLQ